MRALLVCFALGAASCSFITATGFEECSADSDCAATSACVRRYCLPLPQACQRLEGDFDAESRIALAALVPTLADGGSSDREQMRLSAMRLALGEANAKGGLGHRPFALFTCEVLPDDDAAVKGLTRWLVENLEVPAIFSSGSSRTRVTASDEVRADAGTFIMSANSTSASLASLHQTYGNVWRVAPSDAQQAKVIRSLVAESVDAGAAVSVLYEDTDYGGGFKLALSDELSRASFAVTLVSYHAPLDQGQAAAAVAKVSASASAATVVIGFPADVTLVASAAASVDSLTPASGHRWLLSDAAKDPTIGARPVLLGALGTAPAQGHGLAYLNFQQSFRNRFSVDPNLYSYTAHNYDAMWLTLAATAWASQGGGAITGRRMGDAMAQLSSGSQVELLGDNWLDLSLALAAGTPVNVEGSSGPLAFEPGVGAPSSDYEVWRVEGDGGIATVGFRTP